MPTRVVNDLVDARISTGGHISGKLEPFFLSIPAYRKAWETKCPPTEKLVLLALADRADAMGYCWPSLRDIAERTGLSADTAWRAIKRMEASGIVYVLRSHRHTNQYSILGIGDPPSVKATESLTDSPSVAIDSPSVNPPAQSRSTTDSQSMQSSGIVTETSINRDSNPEVCVDWKIRLEMLKEELGMD